MVGGFSGAHGDVHDVWIDPTNPQTVFIRRRRRDVVFLQRRQQMVERRTTCRSRSSTTSASTMTIRIQVYGGLQDNSSLGGPIAISRRHHQRAVGKHVQRRRLLDVPRSGRSRLSLRRVSGRQRRAGKSSHARSAATFSRSRTTRKSCAATGTRRSRFRLTRKERSTSARSFFSAHAITARPGNGFRPT